MNQPSACFNTYLVSFQDQIPERQHLLNQVFLSFSGSVETGMNGSSHPNHENH